MKDNASLLQRWLDNKNLEAERLNEANMFYDQMAELRATAVINRPLSSDTVGSGNGPLNGNSRATQMGLTAALQTQETVHLNPNG